LLVASAWRPRAKLLGQDLVVYVRTPGQAGRGHLGGRQAACGLRGREQPEPGRVFVGPEPGELTRVPVHEVRQRRFGRCDGLGLAERELVSVRTRVIPPGRTGEPGRSRARLPRAKLTSTVGAAVPPDQQRLGQLNVVTAADPDPGAQQARVEPSRRLPHPPAVTGTLTRRDGSSQIGNRRWRLRRASVRPDRAEQPGSSWTRHQRYQHTLIVQRACDNPIAADADRCCAGSFSGV
jgi:hypothetical protein